MNNVNFFTYNENGKIIKCGSLPEELIALNISNSEKYKLGMANPITQYVVDDVLVDIPKKPDGEYIFNYETKQWEFDAVAADLKAKQQRDRLLAEGPDRINPMWWSSMTEQEQMAWTQYRQDLLDITKQVDYPEFIVWPIKP